MEHGSVMHEGQISLVSRIVSEIALVVYNKRIALIPAEKANERQDLCLMMIPTETGHVQQRNVFITSRKQG